MSDWRGAFEDVAKLRERVSVIETNLPLVRQEIQKLGDNQSKNRDWTQNRFEELTNHVDTKIAELTLAIATKPIPTADQGKLQSAIITIGVGVAAVFVMFLLIWIRLGSPS